MQLVCGSDNALTGGSLLLSVYLYEQHIERKKGKLLAVEITELTNLKDCYFSSALISQYHFSTINSAKQCQTVPTLSHTRNFSKIF